MQGDQSRSHSVGAAFSDFERLDISVSTWVGNLLGDFVRNDELERVGRDDDLGAVFNNHPVDRCALEVRPISGSQVFDNHGLIVHDDLGVAGVVDQGGAGALELGDLGQLGQRAALVVQLLGPGVELLDVEQPELGGGVGFQRDSWVS